MVPLKKEKLRSGIVSTLSESFGMTTLSGRGYLKLVIWFAKCKEVSKMSVVPNSGPYNL